jgi:hypothetical protein
MRSLTIEPSWPTQVQALTEVRSEAIELAASSVYAERDFTAGRHEQHLRPAVIGIRKDIGAAALRMLSRPRTQGRWRAEAT